MIIGGSCCIVKAYAEHFFKLDAYYLPTVLSNVKKGMPSVR